MPEVSIPHVMSTGPRDTDTEPRSQFAEKQELTPDFLIMYIN